MNLRKQIEEIGIRKTSRAYVEAAGFPRLVEYLAILAFKDRWPANHVDTKAVRRAIEMFNRPTEPWITNAEPAVEADTDRCVSCGVNYVDVADGQDTCTSCLRQV